MNALKDEYEPRGFNILGFPCNLFGLQEPGATADEILNGKRNTTEAYKAIGRVFWIGGGGKNFFYHTFQKDKIVYNDIAIL